MKRRVIAWARGPRGAASARQRERSRSGRATPAPSSSGAQFTLTGGEFGQELFHEGRHGGVHFRCLYPGPTIDLIGQCNRDILHIYTVHRKVASSSFPLGGGRQRESETTYERGGTSKPFSRNIVSTTRVAG